MTTIKLSSPVASEGGEITELNLREPAADDVIVCGYPFTLFTSPDDPGTQKMKIDAAAVAKLAARLAGVPPSTVKRLSLADFQKVVEAVGSFFA